MNDLPSWEVRRILAPNDSGVMCGFLKKVVRPTRGRGIGGMTINPPVVRG